ncbi:MAG: RraA family protein [Rhodospirillaceae bacterium]|nr:RraA family protein [Rhodospirillaceae bacterium]
MIGSRRLTSFPTAAPALIDAFRDAPTAIISDNLSRLPGCVGLLPRHGDGVMAGTALTVRTAAGDNLVIHQALELVRPGDVIVVDGGGETSRALIGEIMATLAKTRGAAGFVIDGAIRDAAAIRALGFPCFARGVTHRGPYKNGPGEINVPVSVGGLTILPGDIVVGDADGVVAFPQSDAEELLAAVRAQEARETEILKSIREGRYTGAYAKAGPAR